jgi:hypothetical protein
VLGAADEGQIVHAEQPEAEGVTAADAADCGLVPMALVAETLNV